MLDKIFQLIKLLFAIIVNRAHSNKHIWIVSERGNDARDNGYCFFVYLKQYHPEICSYYVIAKSSPDYKKLEIYKEYLIEPDLSLNFILNISKADVFIGTHGYYWFNSTKYAALLLRCLRKQKHIFLQHGIIKDMMTHYCFPIFKTNLFCTGALPEYEFICKAYNHPTGTVQYTGLCRYDNLNDFSTKRQILVMPTWRWWMWSNPEPANQCEWVLKYEEFLSSPSLIELLEKYNIELIFYPHIEAQKYIEYFKELKLSEKIKILDVSTGDVQTLLKESVLLITDYSSVFFDFAYMYKPTIFYQFDYERYREEQYKLGYFDYKKSFGDWSNNLPDVIKLIEKIILNDFNLPADKKAIVDDFFILRDNNNCKRVYDRIILLQSYY